MFKYRLLRSFAAGLALFGLLLQALWPLATSANPAPQQLLSQVCTINGARFIPLGNETPGVPERQYHLAHCVFCAAAADNAAPPSAALAGITCDCNMAQVRPASSDTAFLPSEPFCCGDARAPPRLS